MTAHYFRFPDESTGMAALAAAGLLGADGSVITGSHFHCLDVIGIIAKPGDGIAPPEVLQGWHLNYIGEQPAGWAEYVVHPQNPVRVWA